ncbi:TetR/AcrR family transcriptional regulator [Pseudomonas sp. GM17]|uniref:TetR/AcrR family transcriptional regulator n=1 Tax=Pseudomonas sp. GM17 TaxID=1144323 RepID=UPI00027277A2|nr:TetR/AcrR family transcriptional regulator [Pseudomonas sp. GM17]WIE49846.1 TetR/AcrR family transcriptional regulator [Pseudomonas sp. GM17]
MKLSPVQKRIHEAAIRLFAEKSVEEVNVSELAQIAGVARGTIYNNLASVESLFEDVATQLSAEMNDRVARSAGPNLQPTVRLANAIRLYIRRAHEEPHWGGFIVRYAASNATLQQMWSGPPMHDVLGGLTAKQYSFRQEQLASVMAMIGGSILTATVLVLQGHKTWRDAGSDMAEFVLRALGVPAEEARVIATLELPALPA